jgi:hypothetical protein
LGIVVATTPRPADADEPVAATFALIIGSNVSVDRELAPLKYADDDAANYLDLFRVLGARTYLLSRLDDNTRLLHPQAAAEALEPRRAALEQSVAQLVADVAQAQRRHVETDFYFVYAGHGDVRDGQGYVSLEDARITSDDLARLVAKVPATRVHVIIDACASYFLAYSRGPGGERRPIHSFQDTSELARDPRVGLLLSTSSAAESHEWDGFQAGVFSHEVRSGLYGGADADGDGRVSYREIAAFVTRASAAIPNERFRPAVHARPPRQSDTLLDLRHGLGRRLDIDASHAAHYTMEDARGVRLLDVHNASDQPLHLVRPLSNGLVYLRRLDDDTEYVVPNAPDVVALADLEGGAPRVATRGAAHEAYSLLFSLPFDGAVVAAYDPDLLDPPAAPPGADAPAPAASRPGRRAIGWGAVGLGALGVATGAAFTGAALATVNTTSKEDSQRDVADRNARVTTFDTASTVAYIAGGVSLAAGITLVLWPSAPQVQAFASPSGGFVGYGGRF